MNLCLLRITVFTNDHFGTAVFGHLSGKKASETNLKQEEGQYATFQVTDRHGLLSWESRRTLKTL